HGGKFIDDVSVARGNVVLADHGKTVGESLGRVAQGKPAKTSPAQCGRCAPQDLTPLPARFRPRLAARPLTFATPSALAPLFGFAPGAADAGDLDNKILPLDLEKQFEAAGIGFPSGLSIQGSAPVWSISDGRSAFVIKAEQGKLNVYPWAGAAGGPAPQQAQPRRDRLDAGARSPRQRCERRPLRRGDRGRRRGAAALWRRPARRPAPSADVLRSGLSGRQRRGGQRRRRGDRTCFH